MSPASQTIEFEGYFAQGVLGIFKIALKHHEKNRLIFLFEPRNRNDKVPFDLTTFKYVPISQAAEIPNKVKAEIIAILRDAGAPL